jgi:putative membrane protein
MQKFYLFIILTLVPLLTMCSGPHGRMQGGWDRAGNYGCSFGYGGMFMWILFLIVLAVAIYFIVKNVRSKNVTGQAMEAPMDILKKRYAKGEITKEEFDRIKNELQ